MYIFSRQKQKRSREWRTSGRLSSFLFFFCLQEGDYFANSFRLTSQTTDPSLLTSQISIPEKHARLSVSAQLRSLDTNVRRGEGGGV